MKKTPGRPPLPPDARRDVVVRVRLTVDEAEKYHRIGGATWVRAVLARIAVPQKP